MIPGGWAALAGALLLASCPGGAAPAKDSPALITRPTAGSRAEIAEAVGRALNGATVTIGDDAFVHESTLVIERARPRALEGAPAPGRETLKPEHFRLVKNGSTCVLIHEGSAERFVLISTACAAR